MSQTLIYRLSSAEDADALDRDGVLPWNADDVRDGFAHLSAMDQLRATAEKYYKDREGLVLLAFDAEALGAALKWEPSRGGALFPHYYGRLPKTALVATASSPLDADGVPHIPDDIL